MGINHGYSVVFSQQYFWRAHRPTVAQHGTCNHRFSNHMTHGLSNVFVWSCESRIIEILSYDANLCPSLLQKKKGPFSAFKYTIILQNHACLTLDKIQYYVSHNQNGWNIQSCLIITLSLSCLTCSLMKETENEPLCPRILYACYTSDNGTQCKMKALTK